MENLVQSYSIREVRNKIFNKLSLKNRNIIANYISIKNLYQDLSIYEYSIDFKNNDCHISVIDFIKLITYINIKNGTNFKLSLFSSNLISNNNFNKIEEFRDAVNLDIKLDYIFSRIDLKKSIRNVFKQDIKTGKVILSFDFSFNLKQEIVDVGISYHNGKIQKNYHYIVKENKPEYISENSTYLNFHFGETKIKTKEEIINILHIFINQSDIILLHDSTNDIKALETFNLAKIIEQKKIIDTSVLFKIKNNNLIIEKNTKRISLKDLLRTSRISYSKLHNSGNDAVYTLKLFLKNFKKIKKSYDEFL